MLKALSAARRIVCRFRLKNSTDTAKSIIFVSISDRLKSSGANGEQFMKSYGGISLHNQSHGESFMAIMKNRFSGHGLYILDEPEAALSPSRQMAMLALMKRLVDQDSQFIISTHSPILMAYPEAEIIELDETGFKSTPYKETTHYRLTNYFLNNTEQMLNELM